MTCWKPSWYDRGRRLLSPGGFTWGTSVGKKTQENQGQVRANHHAGTCGLHHGLTLMRPPLVKRHTTSMSGSFPLFHAGDGGVRTRELTSFRCAGAEATCLHHTRIEALSPARWRLHRASGGPVRPRNLSVPSYRPIQRGGCTVPVRP
jgi:hypothetical protein